MKGRSVENMNSSTLLPTNDSKNIILIVSWREKLLKSYMQTNFEPISDYIFLINQRSYLGKLEGALWKISIFDFDGVFERPGTKKLYELFFEELKKENEGVKRRFEEILEIDESIRKPEDVIRAEREFNRIFRECDLREEEYEKACMRAAYKLRLTKGVFESLKKLEEMMYTHFIISGSPTLALREIGRMIGIPSSNIFGTDYIFTPSGHFMEMRLLLGERKRELRDTIFEDVESRSGCYVVFNDDADLDLPLLKMGINPVILLDEEEKIEGDVIVTCPEAREDMRRLIPLVKRFEYGWVCVNLRTLEKEMRIIGIGKKLKEALERKSVVDFIKYSKMLMEETCELLRKRRIEKMLSELIIGRVSMDEVYQELSSMIPELKPSFRF